MVSAYSAFANRGFRIEPLFVTRIEDNYGQVLYSSTPQMHEVISEDASYKMLGMLQNVIDAGTGNRMRRIYNIQAPMGGKTGTTQNHSDGWFMCFTPSLVTGAWVGGEDRDIHFDRMSEGQGAAMALPITGQFFKQVFGNTALGYSESEQFSVSQKYSDPCASYIETEGKVANDNYDDIDELFR